MLCRNFSQKCVFLGGGGRNYRIQQYYVNFAQYEVKLGGNGMYACPQAQNEYLTRKPSFRWFTKTIMANILITCIQYVPVSLFGPEDKARERAFLLTQLYVWRLNTACTCMILYALTWLFSCSAPDIVRKPLDCLCLIGIQSKTWHIQQGSHATST